ncbi:MAG: hypothetical protein LUG92_03850, partial [Oscillospiraceae bacterium]|nr:hypothetical protein [Oscillospiraceae bacterium]
MADADSATAEIRTLDVNGSSASVEVYSIDGEDYVSLRDIAALMNGTDSQFSVSYDTGSRVVSVVLGEAYAADGSELDGDDGSASCVPSTWSLQVNGVALDVTAYEIDGDNFYRLSDIGNAVGLIIEYDDNGAATKLASGGYSLVFDSSDYEVCTYTFDDGTEMQYRFYDSIVYCSNPVLVDYEVLNIYVPAGFYEGDGTVNGYTVDTAPIYNPNGVGGYKSTTAAALSDRSQGAAMAYALSMGYVCVTAAARGNDSTDEDGNFVGLAPAGLVDLKAAIRYLRFNDAVIPGDTEKIISNGFSAGGGMSSLLCVTGNSEDYTKYLKEINAADTRDDVFAGFCFCSILDLENLNEAYEWLLSQTGATTYAGKSTWSKNTDGTPIEMSEAELALSEIFCSIYIDYINGMNLKNPETGEALSLNEDGSGSYYDYLEQLIIEAAQEELDKNGTLVSNNYGEALVNTFTVEDGKVTDVDMSTYLNTIQRLTGVGAMDNGYIEVYKDGVYTGLVQTNEAKLFAINGLSEIVHFDSNLMPSLAAVIEQGYTFEALEKNDLTVEDFAVTEGLDPNDPESIVYIMNPMHYVNGTESDVAPHIYVWQGACDNNVTLATAISFGTALYTGGACEDLRIKYQWDKKHGGNYDIEEMFDWLESFCSVDASDEADARTLDVNGSSASVEVYSIDGEDYVSLRDIAALMNGTDSQFSVSYDIDSRVVSVVLGEAYAADGSELDGDGDSASCVPSTWSLQVNGVTLDVTAYEIDGDNVYKLNDIGNAVGIIVEYDDDGTATKLTSGGYSLVFDSSAGEQRTTEFKGNTITYTAYEDIVYCTNPCLIDNQMMNVYIPEGCDENSPIFIINSSGGYSKSTAAKDTSELFTYAVGNGYVCVTLGCRGQRATIDNGDGTYSYVGRAPATIVDFKAGIRYLKFNDSAMSGDIEKIIMDGHSSGGGTTALIGLSANDPAYSSYLQEINAADTSDDIYACICFAPVFNLDSSDIAYEWQNNGINTTIGAALAATRDNLGLYHNENLNDDGAYELTEEEIALSDALAAYFPEYINGVFENLGLDMSLSEDGKSGTLVDYLTELVEAEYTRGLGLMSESDAQAYVNGTRDGKANV